MDEDILKELLVEHVRGKIVKHAGPYASLQVPVTTGSQSNIFIHKWVVPFYMFGIRQPEQFIESYKSLRDQVNITILTKLLMEENWRPRLTGAYLAAIENERNLCEHIGRLLLRSDVCFAGEGYALALACFNTGAAIEFLKKYLEYYLGRDDLDFDQAYVMAALMATDRENGTKIVDDLMPRWHEYAQKKKWAKEIRTEAFESDMLAIRRIRLATRKK